MLKSKAVVPVLPKPMVPVLAIAAVGLVFLYFHNPQDIAWFPRCPFYALTGYRCPGCGTLRAIHALLHFRFLDALRLNPLMVVSLPVMAGMLVYPKFALNVTVGRCVVVVTVAYWILRNVILI